MRVIQEVIAPPSESYNIDSPIVNQGASQIADVPVSSPMPIYVPNIPVKGVKANLLDLEIEPINTPTPITTTSGSTTPSTTTSTSGSTITTPTASTTPSTTGSINGSTTPTKKPNYLLYGGGALVVAYVVYKLVK